MTPSYLLDSSACIPVLRNKAGLEKLPDPTLAGIPASGPSEKNIDALPALAISENKQSQPKILIKRGEIRKNKSVSQSVLTGLFIVLVLAASNSIIRAQGSPPATTWIGGTGDWFNPNNWSPIQPNALSAASINNGGQAQIHGGPVPALAESLVLGEGQGESGSVVIDTNNSAVLDLGTSECRGNIYIGNRGSGSLTLKDQGFIRSRYAYVAAVANPTRPASNGNVTVKGSGTVWYLYDNFDPAFGCTGAGLFIGGTASDAGGTATVDVSDGATIAVINGGAAFGVTVGGSGTLRGNSIVQISGGTPLSKTVKVRGTLAPKGGALTIRGNLNLTPETNTANTVCNVTPEAADNVYVSQTNGGGLATLGGRITVIMTGTFTPGMSFTLLHADAGLGLTQFAFESIMPPSGGPCFTPKINYPTDNDGVRRNVNLNLETCD